MLSGQAVEIFDNQFRELLHFSKPVNLQQLNLAPEEEPPELVQPVVTITAEQTAAIAKKLINPKYALVKANNMGSLSSEKKADSNGADKKELGAPAKAQRAAEEGPYIHPALVNMPKVNMFHYLPTYVELPPEENQQQKVKASKRVSGQRNAAKACKASADSSQQAARQKKTACESPDPAQPETSTEGKDPNQNLSQEEGETQDAENGWELELMSEAEMEVPEVKEKPSAAWGKKKVTMTEGPSGNVNHPEEEEEGDQTIVTDTMQVDPEATTDGLDGEELVDGVLDVSDGEESDTEEALASNEGESEDVIECIGVDPDQNALPGEENEARLKDECPSNSSTNDTPDWNTDSSSLREQSIASSDSDDYYDCVYATAHRKMSSPVISQDNNQAAIQEENNIYGQGIFGRPLNDFKEHSHSMNDMQDCKISEHKSLEAFFNYKDNTRRKALNKLKVSLEINYLDKFKVTLFYLESTFSLCC